MTQGSESILFIRLKGIGEMVMLLPLVDLVLSERAGARIEFVVKRPCDQLLLGDPRISAVHVLDSARWKQEGRIKTPGAVTAFFRQLLRRRYDWVVDFHGNKDTQCLARACRSRRRVGRVSGRWSDALLDKVYPVNRESGHNTENLNTILSGEGIKGTPGPARLHVHSDSEAWVEAWLRKIDLPGIPLFGLHPGAAFAPKQWPAERFAAVGRELRRRCQAAVMVTGSPSERQLVESVASEIGEQAVPLIGAHLNHLAALYRRLEVLISNDTGPLHMAAAAGTRTVGIFGGTRPELSGPYKAAGFFPVHLAEDSPPGEHEDLETYYRRRLESLSTEMVLERIERANATPVPGGNRS